MNLTERILELLKSYTLKTREVADILGTSTNNVSARLNILMAEGIKRLKLRPIKPPFGVVFLLLDGFFCIINTTEIRLTPSDNTSDRLLKTTDT